MNKYKAALKDIMCCVPYGKLKEQEELLEELVEKATPKKPLEVFEFEFDVHLFGNCPICGDGCNSGMKHCGGCGQAISWSQEEEDV